MKNNIIIAICFLAFLFISIFTNFALLTTKEYEPDFRYFSNPIIISIYVIAIVLDVSLFVFMLIYLRIPKDDVLKLEKKKNQIIAIVSPIILLIWIELIYASFWYYGFGNHQNGLIANNWGIIGSIIFSFYLISYFDTKLKWKIILLSLNLVLHVVFFLILSPINILSL